MSPQIVETDWIAIRPSNTSLFLTLALPLAAALVLFVLDISQLTRLALLCVLLLVTIIDVYQVLQKHRRAVVAFRIRRTVEASEASQVQEVLEPDVRRPAKSPASLRVVLRYRQQAGETAPMETTGEVLSQTYISVYFTSIAYRFATDSPWRRFAPRILAIWPDAIDAESYRQVRVLLRHGL